MRFFVNISQCNAGWLLRHIVVFDGMRESGYLPAPMMTDTHILRYSDDDYPPLLSEMPKRPEMLYVRGSVSALSGGSCLLGIVGTRRMTRYGAMVIRRIVPPLVRSGVVIVSGLAYGTDAEVHRETLRAGGRTIAVLGSGTDASVVAPRGHVGLAEQIVLEGGSLVSAYAPSTPAAPFRFPERNHIIAGLCHGVIVIEAPVSSGALITAYAGLDANRDVYAVPGPIDSPMSEGANTLVLRGAIPLLSVDQLREAYGLPHISTLRAPASPDAERLLAALMSEPMTAEMLAIRLSLPISAVFSLLTELEFGEFVRSDTGIYTVIH